MIEVAWILLSLVTDTDRIINALVAEFAVVLTLLVSSVLTSVVLGAIFSLLDCTIIDFFIILEFTMALSNEEGSDALLWPIESKSDVVIELRSETKIEEGGLCRCELTGGLNGIVGLPTENLLLKELEIIGVLGGVGVEYIGFIFVAPDFWDESEATNVAGSSILRRLSCSSSSVVLKHSRTLNERLANTLNSSGSSSFFGT